MKKIEVKKVKSKSEIKRREVMKEAEENTIETCADCNGTGLKDANTFCITCEGHGKLD